MAVKKETITFAALCNEIKQGQFRPIYILQGEEPYYIDHLQQLIIDHALTADQRDFNLTIFYGNNADMRQVISTCQQYPVFSERKVVVLREAQLVAKQPGHTNDLDQLTLYAERPLNSTILVVCHKGSTLKSKGLAEQLRASQAGIIFDSVKAKDYTDLVTAYVSSQGHTISDKAARMLADHIGNDLARLFSELDKLIILAPQGPITEELIQRNTGISKDYNNFELENALSTRNAEKAYRIVNYFKRNPKNNPTAVTVAMLFSFFTAVLIVATAADKSPAALMAATGTRSRWRVEKFAEAAHRYSVPALVSIIAALRRTDARSKGIGSRQDAYELLRELVYFILHTPAPPRGH